MNWSDPDIEDARRMIGATGGTSVYMLAHYGDPLPKARARVGRRNAYTPKRTQLAETALAKTLSKLPLQEGPVAVACIFYRATLRRVDLDNLLKLVLDAATRAKLWHDDSQVTGIAARLDLDRLNPRTWFAIGPGPARA